MLQSHSLCYIQDHVGGGVVVEVVESGWVRPQVIYSREKGRCSDRGYYCVIKVS